MTHQQSNHAEPIDDFLRLLVDQHCRVTIAYFQAASDIVASVSDLADDLYEYGHSDVENLTQQSCHSVLPRLAGVKVMDCGWRSRTARYHDHSDLGTLVHTITACSPRKESR